MRPRNDEQIRDDVVTALREAPVDSLAIEVTVRQGVIVLRGEVPTHSERLAARTIAKSVGVPARVRSELTVEPLGRDFRLGDSDIAAEVARALEELGIPHGEITAEVHHRVVTLRGAVADAGERARVRHTVQGARGVDFIDDRLVVR